MSSPMIRRAFDAYREAVEAEQALVARVEVFPTADQQSEFDRLEATIAERKAELDAATASDGPQPTDAAQTVVRIHQTSKGRAPTTAQTRDLDAAVDELLTASDVADSGALAHARDRLARALKDRNTAEAALWAPEVARLVTVHHRVREVDAARAPIAALFSSSDRNERMNTSAGGPSIAALFEQYRERGFAAAEISLSPAFMEHRALGSTGGSAVATTFADRVVTYSRTLNPMLDPAVVTLSTSTSGAPFRVPRLTADPSYGGTVTAEAAALTEADATISHVELTPYKYGGIQLWSAELDQDAIIEIEDLLARSHAREIAIDAGNDLTVGNGSGKPNGIVTAATNGGTATKAFGGTATTFLDYGDLVGLFMSVPAPARASGVWQMSTDAIEKVLSFRTDDGDRVVLPGLLGTGRLSLMGKPIYENPALAAVASASKSVLFGDHSAYWTRRVSPLRIELSRDYKFSTDQVALKVVDRIDGDLIDTTAVAYLVSANT